MKVSFGNRQFDLGGSYLKPNLRDCNDLLDDPQALQQRLEEDGYLLIRQLHDREAVLDARRAIAAHIQQAGALQPGTDPMDLVANSKTPPPNMLGKRPMTHHPAVKNILEGQPVFRFFQQLFGQPVRTFDYKWLRAVKPGVNTGSHYDVVYMGRGSGRLMTCWVPLGDIPIQMGTLAICAGSHRLPSYQRLRQTYGRMDVDRDRVGGFFTDDPQELVDQYGGVWQTTDFQAGDVLVFGMFTMHASTNNSTNRLRLSCDTRFQPAADPVDERWVGENPIAHYAWLKEPDKVVPMEKARQQWGV